METLKKWIVRKLGGMFYTDLPLDIQMDLLNRWYNKTLDFWSASMLKSGFRASSSEHPKH